MRTADVKSQMLSKCNLTDSEIFAFDVPDEIQDEFSYYLSGYDEEGAPIWIFEAGKWDMRKYVELGGELYEAMDIFTDRIFSIRQAADVKTVQFILSKFVRFEHTTRSGSLKQAWILNANILFQRIWEIGRHSLGKLASSVEIFVTEMYILSHTAVVVLAATLVASTSLTNLEILAFDAPKEIKETYPYYLSGYDEDGAPIWIFELGKWDIRKYAEKEGELYEAADIYADQILLNFRESGRNSSAKQFVAICDIEGFSLRQVQHPKTVQFLLRRFFRFEEIVRDGSLKHMWIINVNSLFDWLWKLGSPLLGSLANSIELYGTNKKLWLPKLLSQLPRDQLPEWYGGTPGLKPLKILGPHFKLIRQKPGFLS
ncbi:unnamed protein product [Allacma fusca]|uniref:CRAL-TRIO domain-containing protein n=1 Tax=Allacma fusca TaxID=39272 RepID=A0A8J2PS24_9HEXA|nr:unnamed protein product [Allacma fusca]